MAELKDRQQIILLHGAGAFTSEKATELELVKGELVIEHGTDDVKLHTLDNSGNLATIISEKAVDAKIKEVTDAQAEKDAAQAEKDAAQDARLTAIETAIGDWTAATQAEKDAAQDKAITDGDAATLLSAKEYTDNLSIAYDSDAKEIKLMSGETQIGTAIDATDFIKDGMVSNAELVAGEGEDAGKMFIEITFNSDAESEPIRIDVSSLVDAGAIADLEVRVKANEDAIDDIEVTKALFNAVKEYGKDKKMDEMIGPLGFFDTDREGMLIDGFDEKNLSITIYNAPYYQEHLKQLGFNKEVDWVEYQIKMPSEIDPRLIKIADHVKNRYGYKVVKFKNKNDLNSSNTLRAFAKHLHSSETKTLMF